MARRLAAAIPRPQSVRHAARMTIAAVLAFTAAWAFHLPQGYWSVITAIVVMQGSVGGTLGASLDRLLATTAGAVAGGIWVSIGVHLPIPEVLLLILAVAPMALLAAQRPAFRLAPITAVIVLLGASGANGLLIAFHRVAEIAVGCLIGGLTAQFVFPDRARAAIEAGAAGVLEGLGAVAAAHLTREAPVRIDALNDVARKHITAIATAAAEEARERALHLRTGPPAAPLLRTLRRVRSDVAMLGRAMDADTRAEGATASQVVAQHFADAARFLRGVGPRPSLASLDATIGTIPADSALAFALLTLRRDLAELDERLAEQVAG
jgi:uncharacterized membrane protein YccC